MKPAVDEGGFVIKSPCGRQFFLSIAFIRLDYASFLRQADKISLKTAKVQAAAGDIDYWFYEQFDWSDVRRMGTQIMSATPRQVKLCQDAVMLGGLLAQWSPGERSKRVRKTPA